MENWSHSTVDKMSLKAVHVAKCFCTSFMHSIASSLHFIHKADCFSYIPTQISLSVSTDQSKLQTFLISDHSSPCFSHRHCRGKIDQEKTNSSSKQIALQICMNI
ncbi:hypothetical protein ILYODFUR_010279 [Ilyodon furcidens]|uniref:Uncharacterized protein n=1 Tax=Ilyodon furcidens TaxID=33524 RepID=A0ABV0TTI8_9TELE